MHLIGSLRTLISVEYCDLSDLMMMRPESVQADAIVFHLHDLTIEDTIEALEQLGQKWLLFSLNPPCNSSENLAPHADATRQRISSELRNRFNLIAKNFDMVKHSKVYVPYSQVITR